VRNRLGEEQAVHVVLDPGFGFGKEVNATEFSTSSKSLDAFVVLGTGIVTRATEP